MAFSLRFQDPASEAANFLELLLESSGDSDRGAGIFSFASVHGVSLLLADAAFEAFLRRSQFELVVGVDAVTVPAVLHRLRDAQDQYGGLRARAFFHRRAGTLFHPKVCWFARGTAGRVFVGSGNLTRSGLLNLARSISFSHYQDWQCRGNSRELEKIQHAAGQPARPARTPAASRLPELGDRQHQPHQVHLP